jgi:hypothetical protein
MLLTPPLGPIQQRRCRSEMKRKLCGLETGFLKSPDMAGVGMPQVYGREMTTGELARSASMVIGTVLRETTCCHIRGKIFAGKSHQTRA